MINLLHGGLNSRSIKAIETSLGHIENNKLTFADLELLLVHIRNQARDSELYDVCNFWYGSSI